MILFPLIQLQRGRCVSLRRGRLEEAALWHVDPVKKAAEFAEAGAHWMQVVDLDAVSGEGNNAALITQIIRETPADVVVGGGIRTREHAAAWMDAGAARVVFGSAAVLTPQEVITAAHDFPDCVILAVDVFQGRVMIHGWRESTAFSPQAFIEQFDTAPLAAIQITDIDADVGDTDAGLALITQLAANTRKPVIASGMVRGLDDISRLKYLGNIDGAVIGRALFRRSIDLHEALAVANAPAERPAEFR